MLSQYKRLGKHTLVYGLGTGITSLIGAMLLPVYTRFLTPDDYGVLEMISVSSTILTGLLPLGVNMAAFRFTLYDSAEDVERQRVILSTAHFFVIGATICVVAPLLLASPGVAAWLLGDAAYAPLVALSLVSVVLQSAIVIPMAKLRIDENSSLFAVVNIARFLVSLAFTIYFVVALKQGVYGIMVAGVLTSIPFALFFLFIALRWLKYEFSPPLLWKMLAFGIPLLTLTLSSTILNVADRFFLKQFSDLEQLGLYSVGYRIGQFIMLPVAALQTAWPAVMFSIAKTSSARKFFSSFLTYYLLGFTFLGLALSVLAKEFIEVFTSQSFFSAYHIVPVIVLSYIFYGLYFVTAIGVNIEKKTQYLTLTVGGSAIVHLLLNALIIPRYGQMGAAVSTLVSFALMALSSALISLRFYFIPYEYTRIAKIVVAALIVYAASSIWQGNGLLISVLLKLVLLSCFPVILYIAGVFSEHELAVAKEAVRDTLSGWYRSLRSWGKDSSSG